MRSPQWCDFAREMRARAEGRCERCGDDALRLEVHHKDYDFFTGEGQNDVEVLCIPCHIQADYERKFFAFLRRNPGVVDRDAKLIRPSLVLKSTSLIRIRRNHYYK